MDTEYGNIKEGYELEPVTSKISLEDMRVYENWPDVKNVHCDIDFAQELGLPGPICRAVMFSSNIHKILNNSFGKHWYKNSKLEMKYIKTVYPDEPIIAKGKVVSKRTEAKDIVFDVDVWIEKQNGDLVAVGKAAITIEN